MDIYCLSHNNPERKQIIYNMFKKQNVDVIFSNGVDWKDPRIEKNLPDNTKRCWSCCYGHLDMIQQFLNSNKEHAIFCEDDIIIRKDFKEKLSQITANFIDLKLDILLLGYLCSNDIHGKYCNFPEIKNNIDSLPYKYYDYCTKPESGVWGTQMYMLNRKHALYLIDKYYTDYAKKSINQNITPFAADWTITKDVKGNKAFIYPIMAIENGKDIYTDPGQQSARIACFKFSYSEEMFGSIE